MTAATVDIDIALGRQAQSPRKSGKTLTCARRLTRSKVDKTLCDWCLFCQDLEARKKVKGVSIKLLQVA